MTDHVVGGTNMGWRNSGMGWDKWLTRDGYNSFVDLSKAAGLTLGHSNAVSKASSYLWMQTNRREGWATSWAVQTYG